MRDLILFSEDISLKILRLILALIVVALSSYALITGTSSRAIIPSILLFLGLMLLVTGITEFREKRKTTAITLFFVSGFNFYVSFSILLD